MKIRKFVAPSMPQALQQVRDELGDEAVILNTRKLSGRECSRDEQVEITAGLGAAAMDGSEASVAVAPDERRPAARDGGLSVDRMSPAARAMPLLSRLYGGRGSEAEEPAEPPVRRLDLARIVPKVRPPDGRPSPRDAEPHGTASAPAEPVPRRRGPDPSVEQLQQAIDRMERLSAGLSLPPQLNQMADRLRRAGVAEALVRDCIHHLFRDLDPRELADPATVATGAAAFLKGRLPARGDIRVGKERRVAAFVGASGSGKTTAIAKIAAGFAAKMRKRGQGTGGIVIISTDTRRIGGLDQARSYAELIGVPLEVAYEAAEMRAALERHREARLVLIDTPGCGVREGDERQRQMELLEVAGADQVHVVVDGLTGLDHMLDLIAATEGLGERRLLFSKIDEVVRPGALLSAAAQSGLSISYLTAGPALPGGIRPGDLEDLVDEVTGATRAETADGPASAN